MRVKRFFFMLAAILVASLPVLADGENTGTGNESASTIPASPGANYVYSRNAASPSWQPLTNRKALVGYGYEVNKIVNVVGVAAWTSDLGNLTGNVTDAVNFPSVGSVGAGADPITSVRDMQHIYSAGTKGGFMLSAASDASLLSLDIVKAYAIGFFLDGVKQEVIAIEDGQEAGVLQLKLLSLPGSQSLDIELSANSTKPFDEVALIPAGGVNLNVLTNIAIKYAFVGDAASNYFSANGYAAYHNAHAGSPNPSNVNFDTDFIAPVGVSVSVPTMDNLVNDDPSNGVTWSPTLCLGGSGGVRIEAEIAHSNSVDGINSSYITEESVYNSTHVQYENEQVAHAYPSGVKIKFDYLVTNIANLAVGDIIQVKLKQHYPTTKYKNIHGDYEYTYLNKDVQTETITGDVLKLGVGTGGRTSSYITANVPFDAVEIEFITGVKLDFGTITVYNVTIEDPIDIDHHCDLQITKEEDPCGDGFKVQSGVEGGVTWSCVLCPDCPDGTGCPSHAGITVNEEDGTISGWTKPGKYVFEATASDGCKEKVELLAGSLANQVSSQNKALINKTGETVKYELSTATHESSGSLLTLGKQIMDSENIINNSTEDYAEYVGGVAIANNTMIVGVKTKDGSTIINKDGRLGFVVDLQANLLGADVINLYNIRAYNSAGQQVLAKTVVDEIDVISADLIGNSSLQRTRLSVPYSVADGITDGNIVEIQLWKSGVLEAELTSLNIYYAFADDNYVPFDEISAVELVSYETGATLRSVQENPAATTGDAVTVAKVSDNLSFIIDDDETFSTCAVLNTTATVGGGTTLSVNLGRTYSRDYQVGVVVGAPEGLADANIANWIKLMAYNVAEDGTSTLVGEKNTWDVLKLDVIGDGGKILLTLQPTADFNELQIQVAGIGELLSDTQIYGVFTRMDKDRDGVPDIVDDQTDCEEFVLSENATSDNNLNYKNGRKFTKARLLLNRRFSRSAKDEDGELIDKNLWNSLILPVNLTGVQLRKAFGNFVRLAELKGLNENNPQIIKFELVNIPDNDEEIALHAGTFYIIKVRREPSAIGTSAAPVIANDPTLTTEQNQLTNEVYLITNVTYDSSNGSYAENAAGGDKAQVFDPAAAFSDHNSIQAKTSSVQATFPLYSYAFSNGDLYRINVEGNNTMKPFRFWITDTDAQGNPLSSAQSRVRSFSVNDGENGATNIYHIINNSEIISDNDAVYDLGGRKVSNISSLKPGVYVTNGKKIFVK